MEILLGGVFVVSKGGSKGDSKGGTREMARPLTCEAEATSRLHPALIAPAPLSAILPAPAATPQGTGGCFSHVADANAMASQRRPGSMLFRSKPTEVDSLP